MERDPYNTYTDYWPARPLPKPGWKLALLVVALGVALGGTLCWLSSLLQGGL